jgi:hypothetical protein
MSKIRNDRVPVWLEKVRRRFDDWRRGHRTRSRLPESLWAAAVELGREYGINRTARALRLDYYSLKTRVETIHPGAGRRKTTGRGRKVFASSPPESRASATFLEVGPLPSAAAGECVLELEDAAGAKMRVHLKGHEVPDLTALARVFWGVR